jgi:vesicle-fusing ATPase
MAQHLTYLLHCAACCPQAKCSQITRVFEDAYRSPLSVILVDEIERLIEYVAIGPRFSNAVLQVSCRWLHDASSTGARGFSQVCIVSIHAVLMLLQLAQTLLVLIKRIPPPGHKLLILGTSSNGDVMDSLGLSECSSAGGQAAD